MTMTVLASLCCTNPYLILFLYVGQVWLHSLKLVRTSIISDTFRITTDADQLSFQIKLLNLTQYRQL